MEQLFIYLIIFALLIFSSLNKKKKQAEKLAGKPNPSNSEQSNSFEDIFKKIGNDVLKDLNIEEEYDNEIEYEPAVSVENFSRNEKFEKISQENRTITYAERITARKANRIIEDAKNFNLQKKEAEYIDYELSSVEDMKKAVVYSEILSRKYF